MQQWTGRDTGFFFVLPFFIWIVVVLISCLRIVAAISLVPFCVCRIHN